MCGIFGVQAISSVTIRTLMEDNAQRGKDGWGISINGNLIKRPGEAFNPSTCAINHVTGQALFNARAEPTTERVAKPGWEDQQPYVAGGWTVVHNGVIANDKELRKEYNLAPGTEIDSGVIAHLLTKLQENCPTPGAAMASLSVLLKGSFAIIATHSSDTDKLYYATNYRPLYFGKLFGDRGMYISSVRIYDTDTAVPSYSHGVLTDCGLAASADIRTLRGDEGLGKRALVVHSGGLDSTVAAAKMIDDGFDIHLVHFDYGCRATKNEARAVREIAAALKVPYSIIPIDIFKTIGNSRLMDANAPIADTIAGAEQAHEWVPARNLILTSIVIGLAEAGNYDYIALGVNLEESGGGYTDNVLDLYDRLNEAMQWIIGEGKRLQIVTPLGSLMKRDIVTLGLQINAPMGLTYSCYNASESHKHCGKCGPCYMRKTAFEMNGKTDPVFQ